MILCLLLACAVAWLALRAAARRAIPISMGLAAFWAFADRQPAIALSAAFGAAASAGLALDLLAHSDRVGRFVTVAESLAAAALAGVTAFTLVKWTGGETGPAIIVASACVACATTLAPRSAA